MRKPIPALFRHILILICCLPLISVYAQCTFTYNSRSECTPYLLQLSAPAGSTYTQWTITPPGGPVQTYTNIPQVAYVVPNCGRVVVTMTNAQGCNVIDSNFTAYCKPEIRGAFSETSICAGQCLSWLDSSNAMGYLPLHYLISWGSGLLDTLPNLCHYFNPASGSGIYSPAIVITNSAGCQADTTFVNRILLTNAHAGFTISDTLSCTASSSPLNPVTITDIANGQGANYQWSFSPPIATNASPGNVNTFSTQFSAQGSVTIQEIVTGGGGYCADTAYRSIRIANPTADYTFANLQDTLKTCPPVVINQLWDRSQNGIASMIWDYGDGSLPDPSDSPGHIWTLPGIYPVKHIVTSAHGCVDSITKYNINIGGPRISVTSSTSGGCNPLFVYYYIQSFNTDSIQFTSGAGSSFPPFQYIGVHPRGTFYAPTYDTIRVRYNNTGIIRPSLIAFDLSSGCSAYYDSIVYPIIADSVSAQFTYVSAGCSDDSVCLRLSATPRSWYTYTWYFGDGSSDTGIAPCHHYAAPGTYTVSLAVSSGAGCYDSSSHQVSTQSTHYVPTVALYGPSLPLPFGEDSTFLSVVPIHGGSSPVYTWYRNGLPATVNSFYQMSGLANHDSIWVVMTSSDACARPDTAISNAVTVYIEGSDSIWPGDADRNGLVDNNDLLPIGLAYGQSGPVRLYQDIIWDVHYGADWFGTIPGGGPNGKYADCDGDGTIGDMDTLAIMLNYGLTHPKSNAYNGSWRSGAPLLTLHFSRDTVYDGDTLITSIILGDSAVAASGIYGLAFTVQYDSRYTRSGADVFDYNGASWFGTGTHVLSLSHIAHTSGQAQIGIAGIDHLDRSGYGEIAQLRSVISTASVFGNGTAGLRNLSYITAVKAIDHAGRPITLNAGIDSSTVVYIPSGIADTKADSYVHLYPNPASSRVQIVCGSPMREVTMIDMLGQVVRTQRFSQRLSESIDISALEQGLYMVRISTQSGVVTEKLVVRR